MNLIRVAAVAGLVLGSLAMHGAAAAALVSGGQGSGDVEMVLGDAASTKRAAVVVGGATDVRQDSVLGGLSPDATVGYANVVPDSVDRSFPGSGAEPMALEVVPLPAALWLFGSAFLGLCWLGRRSGTGGVGTLPR